MLTCSELNLIENCSLLSVMTKTTNVLVLAIASVLFTSVVSFPPVHADTQVDIDFESLTAGDSVEGLGALHPDLEIQSPVSYDTEVVKEGAVGFPGTAYNTSGGGNNGCLDGLQGMGPSNFDGTYNNLAEAAERVSLDFSFNGKTVNAFSIETYDYGDFNPFNGNPMTLEMNAYDDGNNLIAQDIFEISNIASKYDGCATDGVQTLQVSQPGISRVEIRATSGPDPGVGFDNLSFTLEPTCEVELSTIDLIAGQHIDSGDIEITNDGDNLIISISTQDGWSLSESHVSVEASEEDIPQTKKGNPKPGQFEYSESHEPNVTTFEYVIPISELPEDLTIAVHTVVQQIVDDEVVEEETAWAEGDRFVQKGNWGMYTSYGLQCFDE